jgi:hypothetical protein
VRIGISAQTWVTCLGWVILACSMCGPRRFFDIACMLCVLVLIWNNHNEYLDTHHDDLVLPLLSWCKVTSMITSLPFKSFVLSVGLVDSGSIGIFYNCNFWGALVRDARYTTSRAVNIELLN